MDRMIQLDKRFYPNKWNNEQGGGRECRWYRARLTSRPATSFSLALAPAVTDFPTQVRLACRGSESVGEQGQFILSLGGGGRSARHWEFSCTLDFFSLLIEVGPRFLSKDVTFSWPAADLKGGLRLFSIRLSLKKRSDFSCELRGCFPPNCQ
ncbi:hypothetical protein BJV74DRAFT_854202 [Russula compacta]|nr:hypothetical protein BJV74DRAFT_854202 [Russula compacta]